MGSGNSGMVNFAAETILKMCQCLGDTNYLMKKTCTGYVGHIAYGFRTVSLLKLLAMKPHML